MVRMRGFVVLTTLALSVLSVYAQQGITTSFDLNFDCGGAGTFVGGFNLNPTMSGSVIQSVTASATVQHPSSVTTMIINPVLADGVSLFPIGPLINRGYVFSDAFLATKYSQTLTLNQACNTSYNVGFIASAVTSSGTFSCTVNGLPPSSLIASGISLCKPRPNLIGQACGRNLTLSAGSFSSPYFTSIVVVPIDFRSDIGAYRTIVLNSLASSTTNYDTVTFKVITPTETVVTSIRGYEVDKTNYVQITLSTFILCNTQIRVEVDYFASFSNVVSLSSLFNLCGTSCTPLPTVTSFQNDIGIFGTSHLAVCNDTLFGAYFYTTNIVPVNTNSQGYVQKIRINTNFPSFISISPFSFPKIGIQIVIDSVKQSISIPGCLSSDLILTKVDELNFNSPVIDIGSCNYHCTQNVSIVNTLINYRTLSAAPIYLTCLSKQPVLTPIPMCRSKQIGQRVCERQDLTWTFESGFFNYFLYQNWVYETRLTISPYELNLTTGNFSKVLITMGVVGELDPTNGQFGYLTPHRLRALSFSISGKPYIAEWKDAGALGNISFIFNLDSSFRCDSNISADSILHRAYFYNDVNYVNPAVDILSLPIAFPQTTKFCTICSAPAGPPVVPAPVVSPPVTPPVCARTTQNILVYMMYVNPSPTSPEIPTYANYTIVYNFWFTIGGGSTTDYSVVAVALAQQGFESYNDTRWCEKFITNLYGPLGTVDLGNRVTACITQLASYPFGNPIERRGYLMNELISLNYFNGFEQPPTVAIICNITLPGTPSPIGPPVRPPVASPQSPPAESPVESPTASPQSPPVASPQSPPVASPQSPPVASPQSPPVASPQNPPVASPQNPPVKPPVYCPPKPAPVAPPSPVGPPVIRSYKMVTCGKELNRGCKPFIPIGVIRLIHQGTNLTLDIDLLPVRQIQKLSIYANSTIPVVSNPDQFPFQRLISPVNRYIESFTVTGFPVYVIVYGVQESKQQITNKMWNLGDFKQGVFPFEVIVI